MKNANEFRDQSLEELEAILDDTRSELFKLNNEKMQSKKLEKPHLIPTKKKEVARILTVISEKKFN